MNNQLTTSIRESTSLREILRHDDFTSPIYLQKLEQHDQIKDHVLELIEKDDGRISRSNDGSSNITKTDYFRLHSESSEYKDYVTPFLVEHQQKIWFEKKIFPGCLFKIENMWYQQYKKDSYHGWHTHAGSHFSGIYMVKLPRSETKFNAFGTHVLNLKGERIYFPYMEEGYVLIFPSYLLHRSPVNSTNDTKTIISWNMQIMERLD